MQTTSTHPYLIRAIYEWITDNGLTPYLLVDANASGVQIPEQFVEDGKIILNINDQAVHGLQLGNDWVMFSARFDGKATEVAVPIQAVLAIYAKENGQGMVLEKEATQPEPPTEPPTEPSSDKTSKPSLKLVK